MLLSARILENVSGVNAFDYVNQVTLTEGDDQTTIYFQLVDMNRDRADQGYVPAGRRFIPASGATLQVTLDSIDSARKVVRAATQPFPEDRSIWSVSLFATDKVRGTVNMQLLLTEGTKVTRGLVLGALRVQSLDGMTRV
jgi:hypothetical protein